MNTSDKQPSFLMAISSSLEHLIFEISRVISRGEIGDDGDDGPLSYLQDKYILFDLLH